MKVLLDVNVVVDIWGNTDNFFESYQALDVALYKGFMPCVASSMLPSISYLIQARKYLTSAETNSARGAILELIEVLDVLGSDCCSAHGSKMADFEDALIAHTAKRHSVDFIVTRNKKDFYKSPVPALTPEEFVSLYKPTCLDYEMAKF